MWWDFYIKLWDGLKNLQISNKLYTTLEMLALICDNE